jgi:hypothetical protein
MDWAKHFSEANYRPVVPNVRFGAESVQASVTNRDGLIKGAAIVVGGIGLLLTGYAIAKTPKRHAFAERVYEDRDTLPDAVSYTRIKLPESAKFRTAQGAMSHGIMVSRGMDIRDGIMRRRA